MNWILHNSRLSPTENLKSGHVNGNCPIHTIHDTDRTVLSCLAWRCELGIRRVVMSNLRVANSRFEVVQLSRTQSSVVVAIKLFDEMLRFGAIVSQLGLEDIRRLRQGYRPSMRIHTVLASQCIA